MQIIFRGEKGTSNIIIHGCSNNPLNISIILDPYNMKTDSPYEENCTVFRPGNANNE